MEDGKLKQINKKQFLFLDPYSLKYMYLSFATSIYTHPTFVSFLPWVP